MDKMATTTLPKIATYTRRRLPKWLRWLHGQDGDYNSGNDGYMNKKETIPVAKMGTWARLRLSHWLILLHGQDGDYHSV